MTTKHDETPSGDSSTTDASRPGDSGAAELSTLADGPSTPGTASAGEGPSIPGIASAGDVPSIPGTASTGDVPRGPDQTDRVILRTADEEGGLAGPGTVLVVDDVTGELTAAALDRRGGDGAVVSWSVSHATTLALRARFSEEITAGHLEVPGGEQPASLAELAAASRPHLALMRLPKALADLEHRAAEISRSGEVTLVAGGRVKHMTRTQNVVLGGVFAQVRASRGLGKSRALVASAPRDDLPPLPVGHGTAHLTVRGTASALQLRGIGGVFGGAAADAGSLLLLEALDRHLASRPGAGDAPSVPEGGAPTVPDGGGLITADGGAPITRAIDLGSGNGLLTAYLAAALPTAHVLGSDDDADAVASTRATLDANGLDREDTEVTWDDSLFRVADRSTDLLLLNPPFHDGTAVDATLVLGLLDAAARVLRPGGELWFVHNSHLRYRTEVEHRVGPVRQRARDRRFTVLSAQRA